MHLCHMSHITTRFKNEVQIQGRFLPGLLVSLHPLVGGTKMRGEQTRRETVKCESFEKLRVTWQQYANTQLTLAFQQLMRQSRVLKQ